MQRTKGIGLLRKIGNSFSRFRDLFLFFSFLRSFSEQLQPLVIIGFRINFRILIPREKINSSDKVNIFEPIDPRLLPLINEAL